jgi:integrase
VNPCELVGSLLSRRQPKVQHFAALPWAHVPVFVKRLRESDCKLTTRLAFELLILTAARTGEIIGSRPEEFDLEARVWTLPAPRMKAGRPHRVPLSERAVELVRRAMEHAGPKSAWLFPGVCGKHLSNMAFLRAIRRAGMAGKITAHGFRSSFKSWATALDVAPRIAVELALAHQIKGKDAVSAVEGVYLSDDLLELRASLMATWAWYVTTGEAPAERLPPVRRRTKAKAQAAAA